MSREKSGNANEMAKLVKNMPGWVELPFFVVVLPGQHMSATFLVFCT